MPELYYFRGNIVGQVYYIREKFNQVMDLPESDVVALRPEDV
jgi:hypothetical protein